MSALLGLVFFTAIAGKCAGCSQSHHFWVNRNGTTRCVACEPEALEEHVRKSLGGKAS